MSSKVAGVKSFFDNAKAGKFGSGLSKPGLQSTVRTTQLQKPGTKQVQPQSRASLMPTPKKPGAQNIRPKTPTPTPSASKGLGVRQPAGVQKPAIGQRPKPSTNSSLVKRPGVQSNSVNSKVGSAGRGRMPAQLTKAQAMLRQSMGANGTAKPQQRQQLNSNQQLKSVQGSLKASQGMTTSQKALLAQRQGQQGKAVGKAGQLRPEMQSQMQSKIGQQTARTANGQQQQKLQQLHQQGVKRKPVTSFTQQMQQQQQLKMKQMQQQKAGLQSQSKPNLQQQQKLASRGRGGKGAVGQGVGRGVSAGRGVQQGVGRGMQQSVRGRGVQQVRGRGSQGVGRGRAQAPGRGVQQGVGRGTQQLRGRGTQQVVNGRDRGQIKSAGRGVKPAGKQPNQAGAVQQKNLQIQQKTQMQMARKPAVKSFSEMMSSRMANAPKGMRPGLGGYNRYQEEEDDDLDGFIVDEDEDDDALNELRKMTRYDRFTGLEDDLDDGDMEATFADIHKEEIRSAKIAIAEDLEEERLEEERQQRLEKKRKLIEDGEEFEDGDVELEDEEEEEEDDYENDEYEEDDDGLIVD
eukprot:TRINITY_DN770_c0_g1_i2.p2 TRINITY_DN770_c0_g1~~TRINITY_DN770_c0_g1_i2.p2  ORF type:complete len:573 (+),score=131.99 TRINITY_DN770_c0_g1_i2:173-1891(+)